MFEDEEEYEAYMDYQEQRYDEIKDECIMCNAKEEAEQLAKAYPSMKRFIREDLLCNQK